MSESGWVDGIHLLLGVWCVKWRRRVLLSCLVQWYGPVPYSSQCSASEYCGRVAYCALPDVWCGMGVVWCGVRVLGYPLSALPLSWWWVGPSQMGGWHSGWWGVCYGGGWHGDGRAAVSLVSPSACWCPPHVRIGAPSRLLGGRVEWRGAVGCGVPVFRLGPPLHVVLVSLVLSRSPFRFAPAFHRVHCHSIVGLGLCLSVRVVSLWNSGDD